MTKTNKRYKFKDPKNRESFQRWSDYRIAQLTTIISVMFAISSAALGYALTVISDDKIPINKIATWPFLLLIIMFLVSFIFGIIVVFNRLISFRQTIKIIKLRDDKSDPVLLEILRDKNDTTDIRTWKYIYVQFGTFFFGGMFFFVFVSSSYWERVKAIFDCLF